jgi:hypothetical protein
LEPIPEYFYQEWGNDYLRVKTMIYKKIQLLVLFFVVFPLLGCSGQTQKTPQGDFIVVYQTEGARHDAIGFYSDKINEPQIFESDYSLITPYFFSMEGLLITIATRGFNNDPSVNIPGYIKVYNTNSPDKGCLGEFSEEIHPYGGNVASLEEGVISNIDPKTCTLGKVIFSQNSIGWNKKDIQIGNFSLREQNPNLVLSVSQGDINSLFRINLDTKEILDYKKFGINPALSPDGRRVAYLGADGIRIMNIDGEKDYQITKGALWEDSNIENWSKPEWSADGKKLLYHKCNLSGIKHCLSYSDYSIYVYDLSTGTEEKIIDFGVNPSWVIDN